MFLSRFRIMLLCALFLVQASLHAEYVFYKEVKESDEKSSGIKSLTQEEHQKVFAIQQKYQFPMNLCYREQLTKELDGKTLELLLTDEQTFIQKCLSDGMKVAFIPGTLYELFFLKCYLEEIYENTKSGGLVTFSAWCSIRKKQVDSYYSMSSLEGQRQFYEEFCKEFKISVGLAYLDCAYQFICKNLKKEWSDEMYFSAMAALNNDVFVQQRYWYINTMLLNYFGQKNVDIKDLNAHFDILAQDIFCQIVEILNKCRSLHKNWPSTDECQIVRQFLVGNLMSPIDLVLIKQTIAYEYQEHQRGDFPVYRGTNPHAEKLDSVIDLDGDKEIYSLSYGNSLFSGLILECDSRGAMPFRYIHVREAGYLLPVSKKDYFMKNKIPYDLLFVAPLNTLLGLALKGEVFHSRSRVLVLDGFKIHGFYQGCEIPENLLLKTSYSSHTDFEQDFQKLLKTALPVGKLKEKLKEKTTENTDAKTADSSMDTSEK